MIQKRRLTVNKYEHCSFRSRWPIFATCKKVANLMNMNLDWPHSVERDTAYGRWLESKLFPEFFQHSIFEHMRTLYRVQLVDSLLQHAIYRGVPQATFQKSELNDAIRDLSQDLYNHHEAKWFHVNVHDNLVRVVERYGNYDFGWPLVPIYIMLEYHQAEEGGTTYSGIASANKEWVLLFTDETSITVHGASEFVDAVADRLNVPPATQSIQD